MTTVDITTGEIIDFDPAAAERRAERIVTRLDAIAENFTRVLPMIREAIEKRDDLALGYRSPGEYVADRFGQSLSGLGIEVRRAVVGELTAAGLSSRAIAPVVDVSHMTVIRDIEAAPVTAVTPAVECDRPAPTPVTGIDGKRYERPKPSVAPTLDDAVREFPDLAHYAETEPRRALLMADDLRRYREQGEEGRLPERLDSLRRSIAVDRARRDGTLRPGTTAVMGEDGVYHMEPMPESVATTRTCPTCNGQGVIEEQS